MIDTLNDIDCLVWEISNEDRYDTTAWHNYMAQQIKAYEYSGARKRHPVWISYYNQNIGVSPLNNDHLFENSNADIVSPGLEGGAAYDSNPPATTGVRPAAGGAAMAQVSPTADADMENGAAGDPAQVRTSEGGAIKVVFNDTDHYIGVGTVDAQWPWKSFMRGLYPIFLSEREPVEIQAAVKAAQRQTIAYAKKVRLGTLNPASDATVCSTGYCLFSVGNEYLMYSPSGSAGTIDLASVPESINFTVEYFNPADDVVVAAAHTSGGATKIFSPPSWDGAWVVYLRRVGLES
jgi:hypothetical protein